MEIFLCCSCFPSDISVKGVERQHRLLSVEYCASKNFYKQRDFVEPKIQAKLIVMKIALLLLLHFCFLWQVKFFIWWGGFFGLNVDSLIISRQDNKSFVNYLTYSSFYWHTVSWLQSFNKRWSKWSSVIFYSVIFSFFFLLINLT